MDTQINLDTQCNLDSLIECPICMDNIDSKANTVITECGHSFHCSCLMKNTVHNGFGCPYCRTTMAEEPEFSEEDDDEDDFDDENDDEVTPPIEHIIERLKEQNVSYETLVKAWCFDKITITDGDEGHKCFESYNNMYKRLNDIEFDYCRDMAENAVTELMITIPDVAESKKMNIHTRTQYAECY